MDYFILYGIIVILSVALLISSIVSYNLYVSRSNKYIPMFRHEMVVKELKGDLDRQTKLSRECTEKVSTLMGSVEEKANNLAEIRLKLWTSKEEKRIREDALRRSENTMKGKVSEHMVPFTKDFDLNPADCRFIGSPIDYIVFDGLENDIVNKVVFLEIKTGDYAKLTARERAVRDAIKEGRVEWRLISL